MVIEDNRHYERERFASVSEHGRVFSHVSFSDCSFTRCAFLESSFRKCSFINCSFRGCDLSVAKVPNTSFVNCRFVDSKAIGIDWTSAGGVQSKLELSLEFEGCNVSYSNFFGLSLARMALKDCIAREVEFGEADLSEGVFTGTDFQGAAFLHTNLTRADFSGARNYAIDPTANTIKGAVFTLPEAVSLLRGFDVVIR